MIYGYEEPVAMPTMGVYDTSLMKAYIAGAKDLYDKAQQEMGDFMKQYSDFYSPIASDNLAYYNETTGRANKLMQYFALNGIDQFKSPEARAAVRQLIYSTNTGKLSLYKASAENMKEWLRNKAALQAKGLWDPELDNILLGGRSAENWSTDQYGVFNFTSPVEKRSLLEITAPMYLKYAQKEFLKKNVDRGADSQFYDIFGVKPENQALALNAAIDALDSSIYGQLFRKQAEQQAAAYNAANPNEQKRTTEEQLAMNIKEANSQFLQEEERVNNVGLAKWEQAQLNYRSSLSAASRGRGRNNDQRGTYSALTESVAGAINNIIGGNLTSSATRKGDRKPITITGYQKGQASVIKKITTNKGNADDAMKALSGTYDSGNFADYMNRDAVNHDENAVYLSSTDVDNLYAASEVLSNAKGSRIKKSDKGSKQRTNARKAVKSPSGRVMTATNRIVPVLMNNGKIKVYREVFIDKIGTMYMDLHYDLNEGSYGQISLNADVSQGAIQADLRSGYKNYTQKHLYQLDPDEE